MTNNKNHWSFVQHWYMAGGEMKSCTLLWTSLVCRSSLLILSLALMQHSQLHHLHIHYTGLWSESLRAHIYEIFTLVEKRQGYFSSIDVLGCLSCFSCFVELCKQWNFVFLLSLKFASSELCSSLYPLYANSNWKKRKISLILPKKSPLLDQCKPVSMRY